MSTEVALQPLEAVLTSQGNQAGVPSQHGLWVLCMMTMGQGQENGEGRTCLQRNILQVWGADTWLCKTVAGSYTETLWSCHQGYQDWSAVCRAESRPMLLPFLNQFAQKLMHTHTHNHNWWYDCVIQCILECYSGTLIISDALFKNFLLKSTNTNMQALFLLMLKLHALIWVWISTKIAGFVPLSRWP